MKAKKPPKKSEVMFRVSLNQFAFMMKAIATHDLWDEVIDHFQASGHDSLPVSDRHVQLLKSYLNEKIANGELSGTRVKRAACMCVGGAENMHWGQWMDPGDGGDGDGGDEESAR